MFFNFPPEKAGPQGEFPADGASIRLFVHEDRLDREGVDPLTVWADHEVDSNFGINPQRSDIAGPAALGKSRAIRVSLDEPFLSPQGKPKHIVDILWRFKDRVFEAELSYYKVDVKGNQYQRTLSEVVNSFKAN